MYRVSVCMRYLDPLSTTIARYASCPEDYHLARQSSQQRSRIYARHGPVSSSSSGSSLTRRGRHGLLSIGSRFRDTTGCAKRRRKYNPSAREEIARHAAAPYLYPRPSTDTAPRRFVLAFSACRIVANRAGLYSPNPPISSSNERIISRSAAFSRTFPRPAQFHARLTPSCLLS